MHFNKIRTFFYGFLYFGEKLWVADSSHAAQTLLKQASIKFELSKTQCLLDYFVTPDK